MSNSDFPEQMLYFSKAACIGLEFLQIGTPEEFRQLQAKADTKTPVVEKDILHHRYVYMCPDISCRVPVGYFVFQKGFSRKYKYCPLCGQAINWEKINIEGEKE